MITHNADLLKKGDRVYHVLKNSVTGDEIRKYGTVTSDEIWGWEWISVDWDNDPIVSLFPMSINFIEKEEKS